MCRQSSCFLYDLENDQHLADCFAQSLNGTSDESVSCSFVGRETAQRMIGSIGMYIYSSI